MQVSFAMSAANEAAQPEQRCREEPLSSRQGEHGEAAGVSAGGSLGGAPLSSPGGSSRASVAWSRPSGRRSGGARRTEQQRGRNKKKWMHRSGDQEEEEDPAEECRGEQRRAEGGGQRVATFTTPSLNDEGATFRSGDVVGSRPRRVR